MLRILRHFRAFVRRSQLEEELAEEVRHHLELRREQLMADGMDSDEAGAAARRTFGNATRFREEAWQIWGFPSLDTLVQDVRYAARLLLRTPSFTAVAVLSLALGIGSTAALFTIADAVLFRPAAVAAPHELREVRATVSLGGGAKHLNSVSHDALRAMGRAADFGEFVGFRTLDDGELTAEGPHARTVRIEFVSDDYFDVLGVKSSAGRLLTRDDTGNAPIPVVLSERLWRGQFAADASIAGRPVRLNRTPAVVVGVARGFRGLLAERPADVMVPAAAGARLDPATASSGLRVVARLRPGISVDTAAQRMAAVFTAVALGPDSLLRHGDVRVTLPDASRGASDAREPLQRPVILGLALACLLLLVACANTGGLLLARFTSRSSEFGLRIAIGAGRLRLMRPAIVEALLMAMMAATAGLLVARSAAPLLLRSIPLGSVPPDFELRFDWRLSAFTGLVALVTGLIAASPPLLRLLRSDASDILRRNNRSVVRGRRRLPEIVIGTQVACSLLLLVAAGAMTQTLMNLARVDPGFDSAGIVAIAVDAAGRTADDRSLPAYFAQLRERIAAAPHTAGVSFAQVGLMTSAATTGTVEIGGWSPGSDGDRWVRLFWVGPDFFETLRMPLLAGSGIGRLETAGSERVAVVNRSFAEFYFGSVADAVGRTVNRNTRIVGVAADGRYGTLRDQPVRAMFLPHTQAPPRSAVTFVIRTAGDTSAAITSATAVIRAQDPSLRVTATTLDDQIASTLSRERFVAILAAVLAGLALFLSCVGLAGAVAYSVSERRSELAVRLALGATRANVVQLMLRDPLRVTAIGLILGMPGAYAIMRAAASLLFQIERFNLPLIGGCAVGLMLIAAGAALWPALRAAAIEPLDSLKGT